MKYVLLILLIVGAALIQGCTQETTNSTQPVKVESTGEVKEFDIIAENWKFTPATIEVNLGDKVELHVESVDITHGFMLPDFGINEVLEPHNDVHIEFIADKKGTFAFSCSVPCGRGHGGMNGQLIVK